MLAAEHRFSVREYYRMAETGILSPHARVELLEGKIIDISPIGPFHGGIVGYLTEVFVAQAHARYAVFGQNPIHLDEHSEPQPDLALLKRSPNFYKTRHAEPDDVFLLIEVSDSTLDYDREKKLPAYGRAGIAEAWIVNVAAETLEIYREPHFTGYGSKTVLDAGEAAPQAFPDAVVKVAELFRR